MKLTLSIWGLVILFILVGAWVFAQVQGAILP